MASESEGGHPEQRMSLRLRVIMAMALALSPLLLLGGLLVSGEQDAAHEQRYEELAAVSRQGISTVAESVQASRVALRMISNDDRQPTCTQIGVSMQSMNLPIRTVLRFNSDGEVICSSLGENLIGQPMPGPEWNEDLSKGVEQIESGSYPCMALDEPVIWLLRRTADSNGNFTGSVAITISLETLSERFPGIKSATGMEQGLVIRNGTVVGSDLVESVPLEWLSNEATLERTVRPIVLPQGRRLDALTMPTSAEGVWMLTATSAPQRQRYESLIVLTIPVLAYLAALLASAWIIDTMVLRWLQHLRLRISDKRGAENFTPLGPDLAGAPAELQLLARAFDDLTGRANAHETDLRHALGRMKAAFRETHHRVKNNLQIMLSMLKLQVRGEKRPETQNALRIAAKRVSMMAAVHHSLLHETHLETVDARDLMEAICDQIHVQQGWEEESRHIRPEVDDGPLPSDMAVPLAMFIQEAFDLLCPPSRNGETLRDLRLDFKRENGEARLRISCGRDPTPEDEATREEETNIFLAAFARQMSGTVDELGDDPDNVIIELTFPLEVSEEEPVL